MSSFVSVTYPHKSSIIKPKVVVLAPGAGGDRRSPALAAVAQKLSDKGITTVCFDFPYRIAGKKAPDTEKVLLEQWRKAIDLAIKKCAARVPDAQTIEVIIGGRSMGGRIASVIAAEYTTGTHEVAVSTKKKVKAKITRCLFLSYPLHAPGKKDRKDQHFSKIDQKVLFVSGSRDTFATPAELKSSAKKIKGPSTVVILDGGDHELKTLKSSQVTFEDLNDQLAHHVARFL